MKRGSALLLAILVQLLAWPVAAPAATAPDTFVLADFGSVETLDPAKCYDTSGSTRLYNLYETLIAFDGPHTDKFVPRLATEVPTLANGGISKDGKTYTFKIRKGVKFHEGGEMTPGDVAYSLKRAMMTDPNGGPMWMLLEALTGNGATRDEAGKVLPGVFEKIDKAIEIKGDQVIFHLPKAYPPLMGILAYNAHVVIKKDWCISKGCWDGKLENAAKYNNPPSGKEPLQGIANGTGPYRLKLFQPSGDTVLERFDGYWGAKPKIKTAIFKYVPEYSTRKLMLQNGDADRVTVTPNFINEAKEMKGVKLEKAVILNVTVAMFSQKVDPKGNTDLGSGKLDGEGIPPDFFSDINVRKAFLHAFDRDTFKKQVMLGLGESPPTPLIVGLPYYQKETPIYPFDLKQAAEDMKKAWNGEVWKKGFKMTITYNTGNVPRQNAAQMLAENVMSLNPKFKIQIRNVEWRDYMGQIRQYRLPLYVIGWEADFPDPHNFLYPIMGSNGTYGKYTSFKLPELDKLLDDGIQTVDPQKRAQIYGRLQDIWYEHAIGQVIVQQAFLWAYRDNVKGYVLNPMYGTAYEFVQRLSKN